jgi:MinD-like ATPase involved in chromosome partitioning or flagellar assembly
MCKILQPGEFSANQPIAALIYGQPGVGKTTLALSAPNPILIDADLGMQRVENRFHCHAARVTSYEDVLEVLASREIIRFSTVVSDTIGKVVGHIMDYVAKTNPQLK